MFNLIPAQYKIVIGLAAFVMFAMAMASSFLIGYNRGFNDCKADWDEEKREAAAVVQRAKDQIRENDDTTVTQYVDRWNTIKEKEYVYVDTAKSRVPNQRDMSNGWVNLHDRAAKGEGIESDEASDGTPSGISDNQALAVVVSNYSQCLQDKNQLIALQTWITDTKKVVDNADSK